MNQNEVAASEALTTTHLQKAISGVQTIENSPPSASPPIDSGLVQTLVQQGSPIVILLLLIGLFRAMTTFVKACKGS